MTISYRHHHQKLERLFLVASLLAPLCEGFLPRLTTSTTTTASTKTTAAIFVRGSNGEEEEEPDLFEYFDPLRSPHDYPDGIGPDKQPRDRSKDDPQSSSGPKMPMGLDLIQNEFPSAFVGMQEKPKEKQQEETIQNKFATPNKDKDNEEVDLFDVFDPTISPHAYPNGIPSTSKSEQQSQKVGILLMDHGSRNEASNQRLHDLARMYQNSIGHTGAVVKAVHMEIASPSIPDGLQAMVELGVSEIICHPFFLSPGRHVKKDIPEIVETAIAELNIEIPVTTTPQLGSHTDLMLSAIHSLVEENSALLSQQNPQNGKFGF